MNDEHPSVHELRAALIEAASRAVPGPDCPEPHALWAVADGSGEPSVLDHVAACGSCQEAIRLARELARAPTSNVVALPSRRWTPVAVIGGALAAGIIGVLLLRTPAPEPAPDVMRGDLDVPLRALSGDRLPRAAAELRWTAGPEGTVYDVRVMNERLDTLAEATELDEPRWTIPAAALADDEDGALQWQVTARTPDGRRMQSPTWTVQIE